MTASQPYFIGVDFSGGVRRIAYAALDERLSPMALGCGSLDEVLAYLGGQTRAVVAVAAPPRLNRGLMASAQKRRALDPPPEAGRWRDCRLAEYLLSQRGVQAFTTPAKKKACRAWMRAGFELYAKLEALGYVAYPHGEAHRVLLEAWPVAAFTAWQPGTLLPGDTLQGRLQRQLLLYDQGLRLPDAMQFFEEITRHRLLIGQLPADIPYQSSELESLALAYTAYLAANRPGEIELLGDEDEGRIAVPQAQE